VSCVCTTQLVLLAMTVLQYAVCCWLCQKSENYSYEGLKNYAEFYLINSCFSHHYRNVTVTKFVTVVKLHDSDF